MKHAAPLLITLALWTSAGCSKPPPPAAQTSPKAQAPKAAPLKAALDLTRQASEAPHYRAALNQLNGYLSKEGKQPTLTADEKDHLRKLFALSDDDMAEVESG